MTMRQRRIAKLAIVLVALAAGRAQAQVPQYQQTPFSGLSGLQSMDANTRQASALALGKFRNNEGVINALIATLHHDPEVSVRQGAAAALSKMGGKARQALAYAGVCDPDSSIRSGLANYARRAKIQCHEAAKLPDTRAPLPQDEARLLPYLKHPSPATRLAAAKELIRLNSSRGQRAIWAMMTKDPAARVRGSAIRMLTRVFTKKLLPVLKFVLTRDPDSRVRMVGLEALAFLKDPASVTWLAASVKFEKLPKMQKAAVKALQLIGSRSAAQALSTICQSHENDETRAAAVTALDALKAYKGLARPVIARALAEDRSGKVRAAAMKALSTDHSSAACQARAGRVSDPDPDVRKAVVEQLAFCPAGIARPALVNVARSDREGAVRAAAVTLLVKAGPDKAKDTLLAVLADKERAVRLEALKGITKLPKKDQGQPLAEVAKRDPDPALRTVAVKRLASQESLIAVPALEVVLARDKDAEIRVRAAEALAAFKDAAAYRALRRAIEQDPSDKVRRVAAKSANKSPAQKAWVDGLLPQTIDSDANVRVKAVTQLCALQVPRTYRALVRALWVDENAAVRSAVAKCFADIDHPLIDIGLSVAHDTDQDAGTIRAVEQSQKQRVDRLTRQLDELKTGGGAQRLEVIKQLQPSPNPQVRQVLEQRLLKDEEVTVRRAAAVAIFRYMDREALNKLLRASQAEPDLTLRRQVGQLYQRLRKAWAAGRRPLNINTLVTQLRSNDPKVAVWAAKTLGALKDRRAYDPLKQALKSEDASLRYVSAIALATFGDMNVIAETAQNEKNAQAKEQLIQLNFLAKAEPEKIIQALTSQNVGEVQRGLEACSVKTVNKAVPWIVRLALAHVSKGVRHAAVRTLVLYDLPLAQWAIRVAAQHDASTKLRRVLWQWAVYVDATGE